MEKEAEISKAAKFLLNFAERHRKKRLGISVSPVGSLRIFRYEPSSPGCAEFQTAHEDDVAFTCISSRSNLIYGPTTGYRVRHLTPLENFRLMGVFDEHAQKICRSIDKDSKLTALAGNSIVVDVLEFVFIKLFIERWPDDAQLTFF